MSNQKVEGNIRESPQRHGKAAICHIDGLFQCFGFILSIDFCFLLSEAQLMTIPSCDRVDPRSRLPSDVGG